VAVPVEKLSVVLRDHVPADQQPVMDPNSDFPKPFIIPGWPGEPNPDAQKVKYHAFRMRTLNNSPVIVAKAAKPLYDPQTVDPRFWYDCQAFALGCYENFDYFVQAGSMWDVLNDPDLATAIVKNEPQILPSTTGQLADPKEARKPSIMGNIYTNKPIQPKDIIIWWNITERGEHKQIQAWHAAIFQNVIYEAAGPNQEKLSYNSTVISKNGSNKAEEYTLDALLLSYRWEMAAAKTGTFLKEDSPVGIYRLVSSVSKSRQSDLLMISIDIVFTSTLTVAMFLNKAQDYLAIRIYQYFKPKHF
jgi:hypothetical protein